MSVLLTKDPAAVEIANDLDGEVVNFFRVLRTQPDDLIEQIKLTPYSRDEFNLSFEKVDCPLEQARRLYVRSWMGHGVKLGRWKTGFKISRDKNGPNVTRRWTRIEHLWAIAERLRSTLIENLPAVDVMKKYDAPHTLFYVDPPYVASTRSKWWKAGYNHDMTEQDHVVLADTLRNLSGMVILSGYQTDLYSQLYPHWNTVMTTARNVRNQIITETMWLSPAVMSSLSKPFTSSMFATNEDQDEVGAL